MSNRTEIEPTTEEVRTPSYQHLAPAIAASRAGKLGEEMVMAMVPRVFEVTLSDGSRQRVRFEPGNYPIPKRLMNHFYVKANGVTFGGEVMVQKPQLEDGAGVSNPAPWPTADEVAAAKFDDLGMILKAHGLTDDDLKALTSKDMRRAKITEMQGA